MSDASDTHCTLSVHYNEKSELGKKKFRRNSRLVQLLKCICKIYISTVWLVPMPKAQYNLICYLIKGWTKINCLIKLS